MVNVLSMPRRFVIFSTLFVILSSLVLAAADNTVNMGVFVYHSDQLDSTSYAKDAEGLPFDFFVLQTFSTEGENALPVPQLPCGYEGPYYMYTKVTEKMGGGEEVKDALGAACSSVSGDFSEVYNCYLYTVDWDNNQSFCKQGKTPTETACFGTVGGVWEPAADSGKGECCGDDPAGYNPFGTLPEHALDDPDIGKISCKSCPVGLNAVGGKRFWSDSVNSIASDKGCCGDDSADCVALVGNDQFLCGDVGGRSAGSGAAAGCSFGLSSEECEQETEGSGSSQPQDSGGKWFWANAVESQGMIFNISCAGTPTLSTGQSWVGCTNVSFNLGTPVKKSSCVFSMTEETDFVEVTP
ncbi:MAG: hypothetical protein V1837_00940 [Candidatus Woesearchaeota archaeon]